MFGGYFFQSLREWSNAQRTQRELRALSDTQLNDIGINRGDIEAIAHHRHPRTARRGL